MSQQCQRPGCHGPIIDGICDDCGKPPIGVSILSQSKPPISPSTSLQDDFATGSMRNSTMSTGTIGTARSGSRRHTSRSTKGSSKRRQSLGGGLISLPPMASLDPLKMIMAHAEVPLRKRICPSCEAKVSRTKGFCTQCGQEYNFEPALKPGDLVNQKFEIKGPIAFGGLGWIYLAWDQLLSRWIVLKGLLNAKDEASAAAAVAERQFLAAVKHAKIVGIYDFVQHGSEGYIVMEYVGGQMVESLRKQLDRVDVFDANDQPIRTNILRSSLLPDEHELTIKVVKRGLLPVEEAIAYILGILPAFAYLHSNQFVYCDFKAENFMVEGDDVKLIDMGGVRRIGDPNGDIYGTRGYMAPEANDDPVEVSDLFTLGRTLAVLIMDFDFQRSYENSLPSPSEQTILAQYDALYRFLLRSTHPDPDQRFQSADEMADQLLGVLREIVAMGDTPKPAESRIFSRDNLLDADDVRGTQHIEVRLLPSLKVNAEDPGANDILRLGSINDLNQKCTALQNLADKMGNTSVEVRLRLADTQIEIKQFDQAFRALEQLIDEDPFDWRVHWYTGKAYLAQGMAKDARNSFGKVYFEMPGELAPKLAIAYAAEIGQNYSEAINFYDRVAKVDPNNTTACFGLARCLQHQKDILGAAKALGSVPNNHSLYTQSRIAIARILMQSDQGINEQILEQISQTIESITLEGGIAHELAAKLLTTTMDWLQASPRQSNMQILGQPLEINCLRLAAEKEYRQVARFATNPQAKREWIDLANGVRPRTWI